MYNTPNSPVNKNLFQDFCNAKSNFNSPVHDSEPDLLHKIIHKRYNSTLITSAKYSPLFVGIFSSAAKSSLKSSPNSQLNLSKLLGLDESPPSKNLSPESKSQINTNEKIIAKNLFSKNENQIPSNEQILASLNFYQNKNSQMVSNQNSCDTSMTEFDPSISGPTSDRKDAGEENIKTSDDTGVIIPNIIQINNPEEHFNNSNKKIFTYITPNQPSKNHHQKIIGQNQDDKDSSLEISKTPAQDEIQNEKLMLVHIMKSIKREKKLNQISQNNYLLQSIHSKCKNSQTTSKLDIFNTAITPQDISKIPISTNQKKNDTSLIIQPFYPQKINTNRNQKVPIATPSSKPNNTSIRQRKKYKVRKYNVPITDCNQSNQQKKERKVIRQELQELTPNIFTKKDNPKKKDNKDYPKSETNNVSSYNSQGNIFSIFTPNLNQSARSFKQSPFDWKKLDNILTDYTKSVKESPFQEIKSKAFLPSKDLLKEIKPQAFIPFQVPKMKTSPRHLEQNWFENEESIFQQFMSQKKINPKSIFGDFSNVKVNLDVIFNRAEI